MSVWRRIHPGHQMKVLLDPRGPFDNYTMKDHREPEHLEPKKAPVGWLHGTDWTLMTSFDHPGAA